MIIKRKSADGSGNVPFLEIVDHLHTEIREGKFKAGERIPSESQLCKEYQVNHYVVRQALDQLMKFGLIYPAQGKGYFVCEKPLMLQYTFTHETHFSDIIESQGMKPLYRCLNHERTVAPMRIAEILEIEPAEQVHRLEIIRYADDIPLTWHEAWLPYRYFPDLERHLDQYPSTYAILSKAYGVQRVRKWVKVQTGYPTALEMQHLQILLNTPLLLIEGVFRDTEHRIIEYTSAKYRGDMFQAFFKFEE